MEDALALERVDQVEAVLESHVLVALTQLQENLAGIANPGDSVGDASLLLRGLQAFNTWQVSVQF